ncbi:MAG: hypothetical protein DDT32_00857 [Syntrophomonadaceae bacterium]|nr:hypothetical protein [Bacillota bacterium]
MNAKNRLRVGSGLTPLWISLPREPNRYVWFWTSLNIKEGYSNIIFRLISTVPYQLFCNRVMCGWGPWRSTRNILWLTTHNLSKRLHPGRNDVWLLMYDPGVPSAQRDSVAPWWAGEIAAEQGGKEVRILSSDEDCWLWGKPITWKENVLQSYYLRNFCECYRMAGKNKIFSNPDSITNWNKPSAYTRDILKDKKIETTIGAPPLNELIPPAKYKAISLDRIKF